MEEGKQKEKLCNYILISQHNIILIGKISLEVHFLPLIVIEPVFANLLGIRKYGSGKNSIFRARDIILIWLQLKSFKD